MNKVHYLDLFTEIYWENFVTAGTPIWIHVRAELCPSRQRPCEYFFLSVKSLSWTKFLQEVSYLWHSCSPVSVLDHLWGGANVWAFMGGYNMILHLCTDCPPKNYNRHLGIDCKRTLYGISKIKPDYETMTIFLQFSEDPIWFGQIITKKYGFL